MGWILMTDCQYNNKLSAVCLSDLALTRRSSITRVLRTSSGVVKAAAMPPAALPQSAASYACRDAGLS